MRVWPTCRGMFTAVTALVVLACIASCSGDYTNMLTSVIVKSSLQTGGVCLDGTPAGYFWRPHQTEKAKDKWLIYLIGGGWCYDEADCYARSKTIMGSSALWPKEVNGSAILSGNPQVNPDFYDWNVAEVFYCDGASFSGNLEMPVEYNNSKLWFRGHRVLDAVLDDLLAKGMSNATHILLTGCSAGGLSTFLHADYVATRVPSKAVFKAMPESGFFLPVDNLYDQPVYIDQMKYVFHMQNVSGSVDEDCIAAYNETDQWKCIFAPYVYPFIKTPIFVLNSGYDLWQMLNILGANVSDFHECAAHGPDKCNPNQIKAANNFHNTFLNMIQSVSTYNNPNNGVFLDSCWTHCASNVESRWIGYKIDNKEMREAVADWYFDRTTTNNHVDCTLNTQPPYQCNPTCVDFVPVTSTMDDLHQVSVH